MELFLLICYSFNDYYLEKLGKLIILLDDLILLISLLSNFYSPFMLISFKFIIKVL